MRWRQGLRSGEYEDSRLRAAPYWPLTDGEVHYLYWFIQGSIMNIDTRWALRRAWGLCERHAWAALAVEMAFRSDYVLGPAILYVDLLERCLAAVPHAGPMQGQRFLLHLRPTGPCMICDMGLYWATSGAAKPERLARGRRTDALTSYALQHRPQWQSTVCPVCLPRSSLDAAPTAGPLCRLHLLEQGEVDLDSLRSFLEVTHRQVSILDRSFMPEHRDTATAKDRAALLTAVGWLSGWRPLLALIDQSP